MFGIKKTPPTLIATAVMPLTDSNVELLRAMQLNHPIPEGAKFIAFLEDGDACFLEDLERAPGTFTFPRMAMVTYYPDIPIHVED